MKTKHVLWCGAWVVGAGLLVGTSMAKGPQASPKGEGESAGSWIQSAERVEIFRVDSNQASGKSDPAKYIDGFRITVTLSPPGRELAREISRLIAQNEERRRKRLTGKEKDGSVVYTEESKACMFSPGVAFRFVGGGRSEAMLVCYSCLEFRWAGRRDSGQYFDDARAEFVRLAKKIFPRDKEIQGLKEREGT